MTYVTGLVTYLPPHPGVYFQVIGFLNCEDDFLIPRGRICGEMTVSHRADVPEGGREERLPS